MKNLIFRRIYCPVCNTEDNVYMHDTGFKSIIRSIIGNNHFVCKACKITWRKDMSDRYLDLVRNVTYIKSDSLKQVY